MKWIYILFFNILSIYILVSFVFSRGGMLNNVDKLNQIYQYQLKIYELNIENEDLKKQLYKIKSMNSIDYELLSKNGRKLDNTVIFKYIQENPIKEDYKAIFNSINQLKIRIIVVISMVLLVSFVGNILMLYYFRSNE